VPRRNPCATFTCTTSASSSASAGSSLAAGPPLPATTRKAVEGLPSTLLAVTRAARQAPEQARKSVVAPWPQARAALVSRVVSLLIVVMPKAPNRLPLITSSVSHPLRRRGVMVRPPSKTSNRRALVAAASPPRAWPRLEQVPAVVAARQAQALALTRSRR
jgi:hypothetical protein